MGKAPPLYASTLHNGHPPAGPTGEKARGLARLQAAGCQVPPFLALSAAEAAGPPHAWLHRLHTLHETSGDAAGTGYAVRSSAPDEDRAASSMAGQYATRFVATAAALPEAVAAVAHPHGRAAIPVIIQVALAPTLAGVAFSADPAAPRSDEALVEVVTGHGSALVSGHARPTCVSLCRNTGQPRRTTPGADGPAELSPDLLSPLWQALRAAEAAFDAALDIEWACDASGSVWVLQARPITAVGRLEEAWPDEPATSYFFDQRFLEPISPLTRSTLIERVLDTGIREALEMRGAPATWARAYDYAGQVYVAGAAYRAMLDGAPRWWLSEELRGLLRLAQQETAPPARAQLRYLRDAARNVVLRAPEVFGIEPSWRRFVRRLDVALAAPLPPAEDAAAWRSAWEQHDALTLRFLRLHRWSLLWADYAYRVWRAAARALPARARHGAERLLQRGLRLPTVAANAAWQQLNDPDLDPDTRAALLDRFGHRSASLDYRTPTWADLLAAGPLPGRTPDGPPPETPRPAWLPRLLLYPLCRLLELREAQRFAWERILARQRTLLCDAARLLQARGRLADAEDVWFLTWPELLAALEDHTPQADLAARRHLWRLSHAVRRPPVIGLPPQDAAPPRNTAHWAGLGASGGRASGPAVVSRRPDTLSPTPGAVYVLPSLDPAHTPLLTTAAAVVLERGGLLSHGAILAREYRVPLVVGVEDACRDIAPGTELTVDGEAGWVAGGDPAAAGDPAAGGDPVRGHP